MSTTIIDELTRKRDDLLRSLDDTANRIQALPPDAPEEERQVLDDIFERDNESVKRLTGDIKRREQILEQRSELKPQASDEAPAEASGQKRIRVGSEPLTYRSTRDGGQHSFFADQYAAAIQHDANAIERLNRHAAEMRIEKRDLTSTAGAGGEFIPPLWLMDRWIPLLRSSRAIADSLTRLPLPNGTNSISLPKLSGGGATAIQASENAAVQETDPTTTSVTANVRTIAGQVDMSTQLFEFSQPGMDEIVFRDLARDYATKLDVQVISGSGASGQLLGLRTVSGINAVTYTSGSPTAALLWANLANAISQVTGAFGNPDTIAMHPRRWAYLLSAVDSAGRPLFNGNTNPMGSGQNDVSDGGAGNIQGLRVIVDPNLPTNIGAATNQDVILVYDSSQILLWEEGAPRTRVFEDIGSGTLTVRLRVHGYVALMANRLPTMISAINGTGLVAPTFP